MSAVLWILGAGSFAYFFAACWLVDHLASRRTSRPAGHDAISVHDIEAAAERERATEDGGLGR